jgi:hypothetical protein
MTEDKRSTEKKKGFSENNKKETQVNLKLHYSVSEKGII